MSTDDSFIYVRNKEIEQSVRDKLTQQEWKYLLKVARNSIIDAVEGSKANVTQLETVPERLIEPGATFVTLTRYGELRGCVGSLEPRLPLVEDVRKHAIAAATQDYRFPPVQPEELEHISIEISRLTTPNPLEYDGPDDLIASIRPNIDGVILRDGMLRATFLPQVWKKLPESDVFLSHLCQKMGLPPDTWRNQQLEVFTYQVDEFHE